MTYRHRLYPWTIIRIDRRSEVIARFRTESDAAGHAQSLRDQMPDAQFQVIFDASGKTGLPQGVDQPEG